MTMINSNLSWRANCRDRFLYMSFIPWGRFFDEATESFWPIFKTMYWNQNMVELNEHQCTTFALFINTSIKYCTLFLESIQAEESVSLVIVLS